MIRSNYKVYGRINKFDGDYSIVEPFYSFIERSMRALRLFQEAAAIKKSIKAHRIGPSCTLSTISRTCSSGKRPFLRENYVLRKHKARGESFSPAIYALAALAIVW